MELNHVPLESIVKVRGGKRLPLGSTLQTSPSNHPYIRVRDMGSRLLPVTGLEYVPEDVFPSIKRYIVNENDLIISIVGTVGNISFVDSRFENASLTENAAKLTGLNYQDATFLYYFLTSETGQEEIRKGTIGAVQAKLPLYNIQKIAVPWPVLPIRQSIAHILGTLDDKIELNRQMNATLEAIAQALFQSWFVDFDPVRRNAESGESRPEDPLFPDSFEDSESGEVPKGWKVLRLDNIATYLNGLALQKFPPGDGETLPVIKIAQLRKGDSSGADRCNTDVPKDYVVHDGDVLFSWSGSLEVELWCGGRGALNQHLFKVTSSDFPKWFYYLWTLHHLDEFRLIAASKATTMGHIQRKHLTEAKVLAPSRPLLSYMTEIMSPIVDRIIANRIESRNLATLRDTLLPKLLSGELVSDKNFQRSERITTCP